MKAWSAAQTQRARAYLDHTSQRPKIAAELKRYITGASPSYSRPHRLTATMVFATYEDPKFQQSMIVTLNAAADPASRKVVLDPNKMDASGHTEIDWWDASPDGSLIAVSLSKNGSEDGTLHVYRTDTGEEVGAPIANVQFPTAGGGLAWTAKGDGFWYTRYPGEDAPAADRHYNMQVYFHPLGRRRRGPKDAAGLERRRRTGADFGSLPGQPQRPVRGCGHGLPRRRRPVRQLSAAPGPSGGAAIQL